MARKKAAANIPEFPQEEPEHTCQTCMQWGGEEVGCDAHECGECSVRDPEGATGDYWRAANADRRCQTCACFGADYPDDCEPCQEDNSAPNWNPWHPAFAPVEAAPAPAEPEQHCCDTCFNTQYWEEGIFIGEYGRPVTECPDCGTISPACYDCCPGDNCGSFRVFVVPDLCEVCLQGPAPEEGASDYWTPYPKEEAAPGRGTAVKGEEA